MQSVSLVRDENENEILDLAERKAAQPLTVRNRETGVFTVTWPIPDTATPGTEYRLFAWATDNVGLDSTHKNVSIVVQAKPAPAEMAKPMGPKTGTFSGEVLYGGRGVAKVTVTMKGPVNRQAATDGNGKFEFKDLPPGDYELEAKGIASNKYRSGTLKPSIPTPPPKDPIPVTILLE